MLRQLSHWINHNVLGKSSTINLPGGIVSFSFDDIPHSAIFNGARLLEEKGLRGTFYVTGSYCDRTVDQVVQYRENDLANLIRTGHEIGCHTFNHRRVSSLNSSALKREIQLNSAFIARFEGARPTSFAYPYGAVSFAARLRLQKIFVACRSSEFGLNEGTVNFGALRAVRLYNRVIDIGPIERLIAETRKRKAWLIFYTHDVDREPSPYGCTVELFQNAVKLAVDSGVDILPVATAASRILDNGLAD